MIGRIEQRMLKEGLICLYRSMPEVVQEYPIYWVDPADDLDHLAQAVRVINEFDDLPWPKDRCILVARDQWSRSILSRESGCIREDDSIVICVYHHDITKPPALSAIFGGSDFATHGAVIGKCIGVDRLHVFHENGEIWIDNARGAIKSDPVLRFIFPSPQQCATAIREACDEDVHSVDGFEPEGSPVLIAYRNFLLSCVPEAHPAFWGQAQVIEGEQERDELWPMCSVLPILATLAFPCGYMVRSTFTEGFGYPSLKRKTRGKQVFGHINYDRLYRVASECGVTDADTVAPHFRRGHFRHMWQEAGLNRLDLPASAYKRMRLTLEKKVRRVYVHPAWVGKRHFRSDGLDCEVITGETEM